MEGNENPELGEHEVVPPPLTPKPEDDEEPKGNEPPE